MARFKNHLLISLGFAIAGTIGAAFGTGTAQAVVSTLVSVVNASANPVFTQHTVADNPATQAVVIFAVCTFTPGAFVDQTLIDASTNANFAVPAGKRLVIEYASGFGTVPPSQTPGFSLVPSFGRANYSISPTLVFMGSDFFGNAFYTFDSQVRGYVDPGGNIVASCGDEALVGSGSFTVSVVGHLEAIQ